MSSLQRVLVPKHPPHPGQRRDQGQSAFVLHYYHFFFAVVVPILDLAQANKLQGLSWIRSCGPMDKHLFELHNAGIAELEIIPLHLLKEKTYTDLCEHGVHLQSEERVDEDINNHLSYKLPSGKRYSVAVKLCTQEHVDIRTPDTYPILLTPAEPWDLDDKPKPTNAWINYSTYNPEVLRRVADFGISRFLSEVCPEKIDIIFVQRGDGVNNRGSIPNYQDIIDELEAVGREVKLVQLENSSLADQIRLFNQANVVIGLHGAALSNMMWMKEDSLVIEIMPPCTGPNAHYVFLAAAMMLDYVKIPQHAKGAPVHPFNILGALENHSCGLRVSPDWETAIVSVEEIEED